MGLGSIFKKALPWIGAALGGPPALIKMAAHTISEGLDIDVPATAEGITETIAMATTNNPDALLKLKELDAQFELQMKQLGFENIAQLEEIAAADRASARAREVSVKDHTPKILAYSVTGGFFTLLYVMAFHSVPDATKDILMIMIGSLGTAWAGLISYYFGSSAGSARKTDLLGGKDK
jgi:hypothetical protein